MVPTAIDMQIAELPAAERPGRQHAFHGLFDDAFRVLALKDLPRVPALDTARIASVPIIGFVIGLVAAEHDLVGIDHDDVVPAVHVRREVRAVLAAQPGRNEARKPSDDEPVRINHDPGLFDRLGCGGVGAHVLSFYRNRLCIVEPDCLKLFGPAL